MNPVSIYRFLEEAASSQVEIDKIDERLNELSQMKADLQMSHDNIVKAKEEVKINKGMF